MKNFARIIDLGPVDCLVVRQDANLLEFRFWLFDGESITEPTARKEYPAMWGLDALFDGLHEWALREEAAKVWEMVQQQMDLHLDNLPDGEKLTLDGKTIEKLYKPNAD
jgi:hypothetical protein